MFVTLVYISSVIFSSIAWPHTNRHRAGWFLGLKIKLLSVVYLTRPWWWHSARRVREGRGANRGPQLIFAPGPAMFILYQNCPSHNKFSHIQFSHIFCWYISNNSVQQNTQRDDIWCDLWIKQQNQTAQSIDMAWHMNCKSPACFVAWCLSCVTHTGCARLPLEHQSCILSLLFSLHHRTMRHLN